MAGTVIFDLYGTLADIHTDEEAPHVWEGLADFYGLHGAEYAPEELKKAYFDAVRELEGGFGAGDDHEGHPEIEITRVFLGLFKDKAVDAATELAVRAGERFRELSTEYIRLYPGAAELLNGLKKSGRRVYLLTNAQHIFTAPELVRLGIADKFDGVYISSDYGVKKPDRRFFDICIKERQIDVRDAVMVGNDGTCDIKGGKCAGLRTLYIRSNISPKEPIPEADWVLEEMDLKKAGEILMK